MSISARVFRVAVAVLAVAGLAGCGASAEASRFDGPQATHSVVGQHSFTAEVWADNWFALYVNGTLVGEDSVPITTERSFNKETINFTASYPLTIGIEARDYMETESGLEYIGSDRQQMGDGGLIAQITDDTGAVVAVTNDLWEAWIVQSAPLNPSCEKSSDPATECVSDRLAPGFDWYTPGYDVSGWAHATEFSASEVSPKEGYDEVTWDPAASLIWSGSLTQDNIILFRHVVS